MINNEAFVSGKEMKSLHRPEMVRLVPFGVRCKIKEEERTPLMCNIID